MRVAASAGIPQTHLSSILTGKRQMAKSAASKLRPLLVLPAEDWVDLLAPAGGDDEASGEPVGA